MSQADVIPVFLLGAVLLAFAQEPFQRDKVMVTRGRTEFVPLDDPTYVPAARAAFLDANEPVLGLSLAGETRAYPLRMMAWHHVVNDEVGPARQRVAIVY